MWFAWKFVPLWYQQQQPTTTSIKTHSCDLLENSYLCGISNNLASASDLSSSVVICLKIRTFVVSATTVLPRDMHPFSCDLLENSYLCGISNNFITYLLLIDFVVICLKIRTFVVSATTSNPCSNRHAQLWFAWKFVPLWYQQQLTISLLLTACVVICLKIRTFVVSATTEHLLSEQKKQLWFAWKFVPLWYQQQHLI